MKILKGMPSHQFPVMHSGVRVTSAHHTALAVGPGSDRGIIGYCYVMAVPGGLVRPRSCVGGAVGGCEGGDSNEPPMSLLAM